MLRKFMWGENMIRGLYTSAWGMMANSRQMDVISNNISNANTNGFKKDATVIEGFQEMLLKRMNDQKSGLNPDGSPGSILPGSDIGEIYTWYKQSPVVKTGRNLDLAINNSDSAFFTVSVKDTNGQAKDYYTRDGAFFLNTEKQLVNKDGYPVLGTKGPITLSSDNFSVQNDGSIVQDGKVVDKLQIKEFTDTKTLRKYGSNLVDKTAGTTEKNFSGTIAQGEIEESNVDTVSEMVNMINVMRSYETNQKLIQMQDSTLEKAVNEIGSVR